MAINFLSYQVSSEVPCGSPSGLRLSLSRKKEVLLCPNVRYTFEKIVKLKFDDILGRIRKYRLRYSFIMFIYSQGPLQHNIKFSEGLSVIFNFYSRLNSIFGRNSKIGLWEIIFFSAQRFFAINLKSWKAVEVLNTGINILGRRDWTINKFPKTTLKVKWFSRTIPQACELNFVYYSEVW